MGSVCGSAEESKIPEEPLSRKEPPKPGHEPPVKCTKREDIGFCIQTPPILTSKSQLIFISCYSCIKTTRYKVFDLKKGKYIKDEEIECADGFDIANTVYTYDSNANKIYLIEHNKDIKILDLNKNTLIPLNKSIETIEHNHAHIECMGGNIYILGAEKITNNDLENSKFINIPYSLYKKQRGDGREFLCIKNFGRSSTKMIMGSNSKDELLCYGFIRSSTKKNIILPMEVYRLCYKFYPKQDVFVLLMGGLRRRGENRYAPSKKPVRIISTDSVFVCDINNLKWHQFGRENSSGYTYHVSGHHTYRHSFGVINYRDKYIFQLGGVEWNWHRAGRGNRPIEEKISGDIHVLTLTKDNPYNLDEQAWYQLPLRLPRKKLSGHIHCIYPTTDNEKEIVHIFTYSGSHYTFEMKQLLDAMQGMMHQYCYWYEKSKTAMNYAALDKVKVIPPVAHLKCKIEPLLKELQLHEKYEDAQDLTYGDIEKDNDKLSDIVDDQTDFDLIMAAASTMTNGIELN